MRLKLALNTNPNTSLTPNYNYQLSSAIYNLLRLGSTEFSSYLHDIGFNTNGKRYKLFTFALRFEKMIMTNGKIIIEDPNASLFISSPLIDDFVKNFLIGTFEKQSIEIFDREAVVKFIIRQAEIIPCPEFVSQMKFKLLSPLVLSSYREHKGQMKQHYLRPGDKEESRILSDNLKNKYKLISDFDNEETCELKWDLEYLKRKKTVTKKITINENGRYPVDIMGILSPFYVSGDPKLIKVGLPLLCFA